MFLLAPGYTYCLRHTVLLSMSKTLTLKTAQGIWNILPHSKVEKSTTNTIWKGRLIEHQRKNSGSKKDFKSSSDSEAKSSWVTTPLQRFKVGRTSTFTWRPAIHFQDIILAIWASERPSNRRVPFLCQFMDWTSPICCWRSRAKRHALTLFRILPSSVLDMRRNLGLLGKPELKKTVQVNWSLY